MPRLSRRTFLKGPAGVSAMAMSALSYGRVVGANDRILLGQIGCGDRGCRAHMAGIHKHDAAQNVQYIAVADPWRVSRENAAKLIKEWYGRDAKQMVSYRDLLAIKEIDAVMIASPDYHHTTHLEAAARAGKHVYVEKPMAKRLDRLLSAYDAVKQAGVIVQVGTQTRSRPSSFGLRALWQSGVLGKASRIEQARNSEKPYWYHYLKKDVRKEDVDWDEFLMDLPKRPFDANLFSGWYGYRELSDGPVPNLGAHFVDLVHFITGATFPTSCVCMGRTSTWNDDYHFTCPDNVEALWTYPEGFVMSYSSNLGNGTGNRLDFCCDKGTLKMEALWGQATYSALGGPNRDGKIRGEHHVAPIECPDHFLDWLQCLRSGKTPVASIEAGMHHSIAVLMAMQSFDSGRRTIYDPKKRTIVEG